jgi:hypothetical protein
VNTFVDNVAALVIDNCLMNSLPHLLSPLVVQKWDDDRLQLIGGETEEVARDRTKQLEKLEILNSGLASCQKFIFRYPKGKSKIHYHSALAWRATEKCSVLLHARPRVRLVAVPAAK